MLILSICDSILFTNPQHFSSLVFSPAVDNVSGHGGGEEEVLQEENRLRRPQGGHAAHRSHGRQQHRQAAALLLSLPLLPVFQPQTL